MHPVEVHNEIRALVAADVNDCEISRRTGVPRTTVRDIRAPRYVRKTPELICPRCWRACRAIVLSASDYAELLGLYLGDGYIVKTRRTYRLRITLDAAYPGIVHDARDLLTRAFPQERVGLSHAHEGRMVVLSVYGNHLPCLFPQHGSGKKHDRPIRLEPWQEEIVDFAPCALLRGLLRSDGCVFVNRTGPYAYKSIDFSNRSEDILDLFTHACDLIGVEYRRYAIRVRIYRRGSVDLMLADVGDKV